MATNQTEPFSQDFNVVLVGDMNPAIYHPEWFLRQRLIGAEAAAEADVRVVSPNVTEIEIGYIHLQCTDDRMIVRTSRASHTEMLHDLVQGILALLPHTPLTACGINHEALYHVGSLEQWHAIGHGLAPKNPVWNDLCEDPGMLRLVIKSPVRDWDFPLESNLSVEPLVTSHKKHPGLSVRANTHFGVPNPLPQSEGQPSDLISRFLHSRWHDATVRALEVAEKLFVSFPEP